ncbi:hypothetical protein J5N97_001677 [Dioscorea zingiberensis]|uniref:Uncharacterized protein n=1 Tax=Dioscorea zingiberensis TaxID=325984 RepID=A0A9D5BTL6_9LILI|nr:hypothetical protein J5N97_001677 [Dioscorea zingiberensis]
MEALETQGFFEAVYDDVSSETLEELFGPVLKELFGVPLDVKMIMNHSDMPYEAYAPADLVATLRASKLMMHPPTPHSPTSVALFVAAQRKSPFLAWSNGRVSTPPHRVKMLNNEKRHTIQFRSHFKNGCIIQAPEKLVDKDHPQVYKPYKYPDYVKFLFSKDGWVLKKWAENADTLKAYCGVEGENDGMMKA